MDNVETTVKKPLAAVFLLILCGCPSSGAQRIVEPLFSTETRETFLNDYTVQIRRTPKIPGWFAVMASGEPVWDARYATQITTDYKNKVSPDLTTEWTLEGKYRGTADLVPIKGPNALDDLTGTPIMLLYITDLQRVRPKIKKTTHQVIETTIEGWEPVPTLPTITGWDPAPTIKNGVAFPGKR